MIGSIVCLVGLREWTRPNIFFPLYLVRRPGDLSGTVWVGEQGTACTMVSMGLSSLTTSIYEMLPCKRCGRSAASKLCYAPLGSLSTLRRF